MIHLTDLKLPETYSYIFNSIGCYSEEEQFIGLEQYKLYKPDQMIQYFIDYLMSVGKDDVSSKVKHVSKVTPYSELSSQLRDFVNTMGVLLYVDGQNASIICDVSHYDEETNLDAYLFAYTVSVIYVTPFNMKELMCQYNCVELSYDPLLVACRYILFGVEVGATDIHFVIQHQNMKPEYLVYYRKGIGDLLPMTLFTMTQELNHQIITELISKKTSAIATDLDSREGIQTVIHNPLGDDKVEIRLTVNKCLGGYHYVMRLLQRKLVRAKVEDLGLNKDAVDIIRQIMIKRTGVTFVTGAQCTGKSTTLYAVGKELACTNQKIIEYSSPIEVMQPYTQVDYMNDKVILLSLTRLAKKQDMDIVILNEIPDRDVAFAVQDLVNASIHVLTTIHIDRLWHLPIKLYEFFGEDYKNLLLQTNAIINQRIFGIPSGKTIRWMKTSDISNKVWADFLTKYGVSQIKIHDDNLIAPCNKFRPLAEALYFSTELKDRLMQCSTPHEMSKVLRNEVITAHTSFEYSITSLIEKGLLNVDAINEIV